jgi:eukaryotic-like serine/threonine-protein kinase
MSEIGREFSDGQVVPGTRYRVLGLIGVGGMGSVYDVEHVELGKRFVLKSLLRDLARRQDLVARLRQEWRALARLEHPNIVNVTDAGTSETGVPFYVMERLDGETLGARLGRERRLPVQAAVDVAAGVLEGLSAAHAIGIVHRDVKPPNIFVLGAGGVKLLDFGIAKIASSSAEVITARGLAIGTPRYMSPEQARGERVDGRADLYAVGLLLFEMIAGTGPFDDASDANDLLLAQLTRPAARLSSAASGIPPELDAIVAALLEKDPRQRPASARVVARALKQAVGRASLPPPVDASDAESLARASDPPTELPGTRRDGVAARAASPSAPALSAKSTLRLDPAALNARTTLRLDAPTLNEPGSNPTELGARTAVSVGVSEALSDATEQQPALAVADTQFVPNSSGAGARSDRTLTLEQLGDAPRSLAEPAATRTAVPVAAHGGETPPPVESGDTPVSSATRQLPKRALAFGGAAFVILAAVVGAWALRGEKSAPDAGAPASSAAPAAASAEPAPARAAVAPAPSLAPAPSVAPAPQQAPVAASSGTPSPLDSTRSNRRVERVAATSVAATSAPRAPVANEPAPARPAPARKPERSKGSSLPRSGL